MYDLSHQAQFIVHIHKETSGLPICYITVSE